MLIQPEEDWCGAHAPSEHAGLSHLASRPIPATRLPILSVSWRTSPYSLAVGGHYVSWGNRTGARKPRQRVDCARLWPTRPYEWADVRRGDLALSWLQVVPQRVHFAFGTVLDLHGKG